MLMDATLMRGDDTRRIQLCDLFSYAVAMVRPHAACAFGIVTDQSKTNKVWFCKCAGGCCVACSLTV